MLERKASGKRGKERLVLTRRGRKWLHGIALAVLPIVTAAGIMTESMAALYATLIGAILVPWVALEDNHSAELESRDEYERGLDEGYQVGTEKVADVAEQHYNLGIDDSFKPYDNRGNQ